MLAIYYMWKIGPCSSIEDKMIQEFFSVLLPWKRIRSREGEEDLLNRNNSKFFLNVLDNGGLCLLFPGEFSMRRKECNCMPLWLSPFAVQRGPHGHGVLMTGLKRTLTSFAKKGREAGMQRISLRSSKGRTAAPNFQKHIAVFEEAKQYQE